jgi:hypothetical protein
MPWHFPAFSQGFHHGFLVGSPGHAGNEGDGSAAVLECRGLQLLQNQVIFGARAAWEPKHEIFMKCSWQVIVGSLWILIWLVVWNMNFKFS